MATLSTIIKAKNPAFSTNENNMEKGRLFYFSPLTENSQCSKFTWKSPGSGTARVEIWGAGGSGGKMCCCGGGVGGNPGAYVVKTFTTDSASRVCGCIGISCGNADAMCYRGRSIGSCVCWFGKASESSSCGCLCAEGGDGGTTFCSPSGSTYCCFVQSGAFNTTVGVNPAGTAWGTGCGIVCNTKNAVAAAYGGDLNCPGGISCTSFYNCDSANHCYEHFHMRTPAGVHSTCGGTAIFSADNDSAISVGGTAQYQTSHKYALEAMSRSPSAGMSLSLCYFSRQCGCYENNGCQTTLPHGHGGAPATTCNSVRDQGQRGGMGAVRILWTQ